MGSAHHLTEANIWPMFKENPSRGKGNGAASKFKVQTGDLKLWPWPWVSIAELWVLHIISLRQTFDQSLKKILPEVKEIWRRHRIQGSNSWPSTVTLTLSQQGWVMGSAHCPSEVKIWPKFTENPPRGKGDTERTQNSRLKPHDLELWPCESAWLSYGFCTSFQKFDQN